MAEMQTSVSGDGTQAIEGRDRRGLAASFAAVGTAFLAALCCIGPVLFVTLGIGAGLASRFEPLRPIFTILTVGLIAIGFYTVYGRRPAARMASASTLPQGYTATERILGGDVATTARTKTVTFKVEGMTCGGCVIGVRKVLTRLPGVSKVDVTYEESRAVVIYDPAKVTVKQMAAAIASLGYKATVVTSTATS